MRRRVKERDADAPPLDLLTFTGTTNRERFAWMQARADWWEATHDPEAVGDLKWLIDGHNQVGNFAWCGSLEPACNNPDCLCELSPLEQITRPSIPTALARTPIRTEHYR